MNCTSNHKIEIHTFNVTTSGWKFFIINRNSTDLLVSDSITINFMVIN